MKTYFQKALHLQKQRGYSMVELSVVLVIVALLSAAVFFGLQANSRRIEVADNVSQIAEISAGLKKNFGRTNQYGLVTVELAVQSRVIPQQLKSTGNKAQNSYGGQIGLTPATCGVANSCVDLVWPKVATDQCMDLVIGVEGGARAITVGSSPVKPLDGSLNLAALGIACDIAATNQDHTYTIGR